MRRSIGLPLTIGIVLVVLALALAIGWNVLVVRGVGDVRQVAERLSNTHWVLLSLGTLFYALLIAGLTLLCAWLVREMRHSQRQQAFLDAVTHEMKTPLASLRLYLDTLARRDPGAAQREVFHGRMRQDVDRLERTVDQVLAAARAARARGSQRMPVAIGELLATLVREAREQYHLEPDVLRLEIDGDPTALGEANELSLIFRNLIDNAIKYSGAQIDVRVAASASPDGGVRVQIEDRGVGIPREELRRIFQPFYRAGVEAQRRVKGLGLGLFIVRFLVRRQGGRVEAHSAGPGQGSRFQVWLRGAPSALARTRGTPAPVASYMGSILVVEDEVHIAEGLRFNLEAEGHEVVVAGDGRVALEQLLGGARRFDLVLLDWMLPEASGVEVARRVRAAGNFVPILILTAKDHPADLVRGIEEGADDYLTKPFVLEELLARVRALLRRRRWDAPADAPSRSVAFGDVTIDFDRFELNGPQGAVELTTREASLLRALVEREGRAVPRGELLEVVWGLRPETNTRVVDTFVARLRRYVERDPSRPQHILSVRGHGYKFLR